MVAFISDEVKFFVLPNPAAGVSELRVTSYELKKKKSLPSSEAKGKEVDGRRPLTNHYSPLTPKLFPTGYAARSTNSLWRYGRLKASLATKAPTILALSNML